MKIAIFSDDINTLMNLLNYMEQKKVKYEVALLSTSELENKELSFQDKILKIENMNVYGDIPDIVIFSTPKVLTEKYIKKFIGKCIIIDESGWSLDTKNLENSKLIIPNINIKEINNIKNNEIVSFPNVTTIQLLGAINPLYDIGNIKRVVVSTYQSVSNLGKSAMDELFEHTKKIYENNFLPSKNFKKQITFNVLPQIGDISYNKQYEIENRVIKESKIILNNDIKISITCSMVPVFVGDCQSVNVEFDNDFNEKDIYDLYEDYDDSISVIDRFEDFIYATPKEVALDDSVFISRIRRDNSLKYGLNLWSVADATTLRSKYMTELVLKIIKMIS